MKYQYTNYIPSIVFFVFIVGLITLADLNQKNLVIGLFQKIPFGDKLGHLILFGIMALLTNMAMKFKRINVFNRKFHLGTVLVLSFAVLEEFSQLAFSSRTFEFIDMLSDLFGIGLLSSIVFREYFIKQLRRLTNSLAEKMLVE